MGIGDLMDALDAELFTGCLFLSDDLRAQLRSNMARWERRLKELEQLEEDDNES